MLLALVTIIAWLFFLSTIGIVALFLAAFAWPEYFTWFIADEPKRTK